MSPTFGTALIFRLTVTKINYLAQASAQTTAGRVCFFKNPTMHYFDPNVAAAHGIDGAILINHFQYWIKLNQRNEKHTHEGRTWTYTSAKALKEWIPYMSEKKIWAVVTKLIESGVLMKGNFNKTAYDRTSWYAFTLEGFWIRPEGEFHFPKSENGSTETGRPIPDLKTDKEPDAESAAIAAGSGDQRPKKPSGKKKTGTPGAEPDRSWQRWIDRYEEHVKLLNGGIGHDWKNKSQMGENGLKGIRAHLVSVSIKVEGTSAEDCGYGAWDYILKNWQHLNDDYLQKQFDLTVIRKKITDIINRLKNGGSKTTGRANEGNKPGTSQQREQALANY